MQLKKKPTPPPPDSLPSSLPLVQEAIPPIRKKRNKLKLVLWILGGALGGYAGLTLLANWLAPVVGCGNRARTIEAQHSIGAMNRGQEAYFLDKNQFSNALQDLELGIAEKTTNYHYKVVKQNQSVIHYAIPTPPEKKEWFDRSNRREKANTVGGVFLVPDPANPQKMTTKSIVCREKIGDYSFPRQPFLDQNTPTCPTGYIPM